MENEHIDSEKLATDYVVKSFEAILGAKLN